MKPLPLQKLSILLILAALSGCSILEEDKVNYKSASKGPGLEVPPDLTQLRKDSRYALESTSATASGFGGARQSIQDTATAASSLGDVRMERSGHQRWLVVQRPPEKVWDSLREFWTGNGFALTTDAAELGILETDWAENRAKIPQDFIRKTLGKVLDGLYSTGERDRYRTRVERNAAGGVDIFISHRGMVEDWADAQKSRTVWMPRASDPELEIEFLRRLMVKLGASAEQAKQQTASATATANPGIPSVAAIDGQAMLVLQDSLDRAWRRTGIALDRSGFTVEDRDRSQGIYFVRYVPPTEDKSEPGFFGKLFASKPQAQSLTRYQIQLQASANDTTRIRLLDAAGQPAGSGPSEKILQLLATQLR